MAYTILHLSDLHRSDIDPIGNDELLSTLLADRDRFVGEDPSIGDPDAIIVSGDLVQGVPLGTSDFAPAVAEQYGVAYEFLTRLADEFLAGDRSSLIVVPGNHDVCWNTALAAMEPVDADHLPRGFSPASCGPTADLRWRWDGLQAYRITDRVLYEQRLSGFVDLVQAFYADSPEVVHAEHFRMHSMLQGRIGIVAFNSCVGNDCFAFHGAILEEAVAQAHMMVRPLGHELLVAVWHHSISGEPSATDYMSVSTVQRMIGRGFRLGFHGHQHRAAAALQYIHLPEEERMAVISAGSLCAGPRELPTGINRQYNVVEIADDLSSARVHVREMSIATNFAPARRNEFGGGSFVDITWQLPNRAANANLERSNRLTLEAEAALSAGDLPGALSLLSQLPPPRSPYARRLQLDAMQQLEAWDDIVDEFSDPATIAELSAVAVALARLGRPDEGHQLLDVRGPELDLPEPAKRDLQTALKTIGANQ